LIARLRGDSTRASKPISGSIGFFLSIDQGNQRQRMIIGFGMGASEGRVLMWAVEMTEDGRQLVDNFYIITQSSWRPGVGPMGGVVAGNAVVGLALSSTSMLVGARSQKVEADPEESLGIGSPAGAVSGRGLCRATR